MILKIIRNIFLSCLLDQVAEYLRFPFCRKQGLVVQPFSVDSQTEPLLLPADLFPDPWALHRSTRLIREWIGLAYYRLLGRI